MLRAAYSSGHGRAVPIIVLALLAACGRHSDERDAASEPTDEARDPDLDNATLRRQALSEWFDEAHTSLTGPFSLDFRATMMRTAEQERLRWGTQLPSTNGNPSELVAGTNWSNLGPTKANNLINGA